MLHKENIVSFKPIFHQMCHLLAIVAASFNVAQRKYCFIQTKFSLNMPPSWQQERLSLMLQKENIISFKSIFTKSATFSQ